MAAEEQEALIAGLLVSAVPDGLAVTPRERALLTYADKLTRAPASIVAADIAPLREVGLDDRGIHDACAIVAYFAFVNRVADGLGVELESPSG
ncbi:MAG: peroxidase [Gemmatimonadota bacterium]|nr:peroxidase [Gemmatimonadota bacterium]